MPGLWNFAITNEGKEQPTSHFPYRLVGLGARNHSLSQL